MPNGCRYHLTVVAGLLALSCLVQVLAVSRSVVPGLDAVRFVGIAQSIDEQGIADTLEAEGEQPLFPAWVALVHRVQVGIAGDSSSAWAKSVQTAAAVPLVLAIVPLYLALLRMVGARSAAAACVFFCLLPEVARLGADGLSDSTHLLFFCVAFWAIVEYLQGTPLKTWKTWPPAVCHVDADGTADKHGGESVDMNAELAAMSLPKPEEHNGYSPHHGWLLLAGAAAGAAILARAETLVLVAALGTAAIIFQLLPRYRMAWSRLAASLCAFALGLAFLLGPYLLLVSPTTFQTAADRILGRFKAEERDMDELDDWRLPNGEPMAFTVREPTTSIRHRGFAAAIVRFGRKLADAYGYWIGGLALLGAWLLRRESTRRIDRFVQIFFALFSLLAIRFAAREGYMHARHVIPLVVVGIGCAGSGGPWLGEKLTAKMRLKLSAAWLVVALAAAMCVPRLLVPLHHSRLGHRQAAEWISAQAETPGAVLDTHGWTGLYSGRRTYGYDDARRAFSDPQLIYVVVEEEELRHDSGRARTLGRLIELAGKRVATFPSIADSAANRRQVVIYRWEAERFKAAGY